MDKMTDELLIECYFLAIELHLQPEFITLLETEIRRRSLSNEIKLSS